jgi:hypothetical protein
MKVSSITVQDMIGRWVANENGAEFQVVDVRYDVTQDDVVIELHPQGSDDPDDTVGVTTLKGWTLL